MLIIKVYKELLEANPEQTEYHLYIACCMFYLGMMEEAEAEANQHPECPLQVRVLFHLAHKANDESKLMVLHQKLKLQETIEDQVHRRDILAYS